MELLRHLDPRLQADLAREVARRRSLPVEGLPRGVTVVLAGHRAAGKSTVLPHVAALLGREAVDLDVLLEQRAGRSLRRWFMEDERGFRQAERACFESLSKGLVVAVGGGFLSEHGDALQPCVTVLVPVSFETYAERLRLDTSRPRLRPQLALEEELREIWLEREERHRRVRTLSFVELLLRAQRPTRARRVVTLAPGVHPVEFAWRARNAGAELLELRTDLLPLELDVAPIARALPLLIAERGRRAPGEWTARAALLDADEGSLRSFHAETPLTTAEALARWARVPDGVQVKHVEPLGPLADASRLLSTQRALIDRFGPARVTVLATGLLALPFRAVLAERNALDFLALDASWSAAVGQRLVADAARSARLARHDGVTERLGILGGELAHSRSPRLHAQPFDRLQLPAEAPLEELLGALTPHYRGFAVTNPFKQRVAAWVKSERGAVNTLVRDVDGWRSANTDREGAMAMLLALKAKVPFSTFTVLGSGGVRPALEDAAAQLGLGVSVLRRADAARHVRGVAVWTWPASLEAPAGLRLDGATVAVIGYGTPARQLARQIERLGGAPVRLGARWFIAQARRQRELWEPST